MFLKIDAGSRREDNGAIIAGRLPPSQYSPPSPPPAPATTLQMEDLVSLEVLDLPWSYAEDVAAVKQFHTRVQVRMERGHACLFSQFSILTVPNVSHSISRNF